MPGGQTDEKIGFPIFQLLFHLNKCVKLRLFGYSSEQLKLREYQELKDMLKSQEKLAQIVHSKLKEDLQRDFENEIENQEKLKEEKMLDQILDPQEVQDVLLNTKLINDI